MVVAGRVRVPMLMCAVVTALLAGCANDDEGGGPAAGAGAGGAGFGGAPAEAGVPCNVAQVISANCTLCHTNPPKFGALMPLMTLADFQAASLRTPERKVYQVVPERINATDIRLRMPPASSPALMPADLQALNTWVQGGAQGVTSGACPIMAM